MFIVKNLSGDFRRNRTVNSVLFFFILLSSLFASAGTALIVNIAGSIGTLFSLSEVPHFIQMHSGEIETGVVRDFADADKRVKSFQIAEMLAVDSGSIYLGESGENEAGSVMDISFVRQNSSFDFLLDLENSVINLSPGEIAVPVYFMQKRNLKPGNTVQIKTGQSVITFTIAAFLRDPLMNPAVVHSKRFLVSDSDYLELAGLFDEKEYLIEFLLEDPADTEDFSASYASSGLPSGGPSLDINLFRLLNSLADGITAAVIILASLLVILVAILALRFVLLASMESDSREIGVMKAIGLSAGSIRKLYLVKYLAVGLSASLSGWLLSVFLFPLISSGITLYAGKAKPDVSLYAIPLAASLIVSLTVAFSCLIILRRFKTITAVQALRSGDSRVKAAKHVRFSGLKKTGIKDINIFLAMRDLRQKPGMFSLLFFVFFFSVFLAVTPANFLSTIKSPDFISYMGIGRSDIRIDLRHSENSEERFLKMTEYLKSDSSVARVSPLVTSRFQVTETDGSTSFLNIETGDFSVFPLSYTEGRAPLDANEIALSSLKSREAGKGTGDSITVRIGRQEKKLKICGIYQDVTNGGRTAKALLPYNRDAVLWYTVNIDLASNADINKKTAEYSTLFHPARVTGIEGYLSQTLENTIRQLEKAAAASVAAGVFISALITLLFLKMLTARDAGRNAVMRSLGFSQADIRRQYLLKTLLLLALGTLAGTFFSNTVGEDIAGAFWSLMGAEQVSLVINPIYSYIVIPLLLVSAVIMATLSGITDIRELSIAGIINE